MVDLIPGTTLPIHVGPGGRQSEGRGAVGLTPERQPPSMIDPNAPQPSLGAAELAFVRAAIAAYDRKPRKLKTIYDSASGQTDSTTGNLVLPLFVNPAGCEGHVTNVFADAPLSATVTPSAPLANASIWAFLAIVQGSGTTGTTAANADTLRRAGVASVPNTAGGVTLPGGFTFTDAPAPTMFGGDALFFVMHGGSIAGALSLLVQVTYKIELFGFEDGQL